MTNLQYGFQMALLGNNPEVRSIGFQWVSYGIYWYETEPNPGQFNWANVDNIVNGARNGGVNVLIRVSRSPAWAADPNCPTPDTCPPRNPSDFGDFMGALAAHVAPMIAPYRVAYEIWNEPNTDVEWGGMCPDPAAYARLLAAAYPAVKAADPSAIVAGGAVTTVGEQRSVACYMDDLQFIQGMYSAGARPYFDVLSDHPYGFASPPEADPLTTNPPLVFRRAERHYDVMVANGDGNKQIWATEMGWAMDPRSMGYNCDPPDWYYIFTPQQQSDYLVRAFQWARSYWPWMGNMFIFNFDFEEAPWYQGCAAFKFWSVKGHPAESALASFALNPPPTYTPVVDNPPVISAVRYSQLNFGNAGGTLTVDVDASDADQTPIDTVQAIVQYPDQSTQLFTFTLVSGNNQNGTWETTISIAPNYGAGPVTYTISPYAVETAPPRRTTSAPPQQITVANTRFWDVPSDYWAYQYIEALANQGVIGGYNDGSFRPGNSATRAQLSKIVVLGFNFALVTPPTAHFQDVSAGSTFYTYVETAYNQGLISGYPCGGPGEPCVPPDNKPYFRPNNPVTRGQIAKIVVLAAAWPLSNPPNATFQDVPVGSAFYPYVETSLIHGILSGYTCGGPGEPCVPPDNKPYFRPGNNATRAQICKLVYLAIGQTTPTPVPTSTPTRTATPVPTSTPTRTSTPTGTPTLMPSPTTTPMATPT